MATLVGAQVAAIIMSPVSATASVPSVKAAHEAGIPVVCYNSCINDADATLYVSALVTTDQTKLGADIGNVAGDYFIKAGKTAPKIATLNCDVYEACHQRKVGFMAAIKAKVPGVQFVADQEGFVVDKATTVASNIITAHPDIDAFWTPNEGGTIGAVQAVKGASMSGKIVVFGEDMDTQIAGFLKEADILKATNAQQPQLMGSDAVQIALKVIKGQAVDRLVIIPTTVYTSDNQTAVAQWLSDHADGLP